VAHDFNNLLSVISSVSEGLRSSLGTSRVEQAEMLDELDDATSRAVLITRQLLSFGRTEQGATADVDLDGQVRAMQPMLERLIGHAITLQVQSEPAAVVRATRAGLEQVLLNLAVNARDAMPDGGVLRIEMHVEGETVRLLVIDSGIGMDSATKERIFAPFFTTKANGTGLGLATVREKVEQFGGTITVDTEPGRGSTFEVRLTRAERAALPATPALTPELVSGATSTTSRLLVVDDDATVRRAVARLLEQAGFEVVAVTNGAEAVALLERPHEFVCVISDLAMPVLDGAGLAARLTELEPTLPLVLMSGNRIPDESLLGPRRLFLEKPVGRATLLRAIEQVRGAAATLTSA
jgi:CheY-like chemotaxis protein/two-component sensor histidine kinase